MKPEILNSLYHYHDPEQQALADQYVAQYRHYCLMELQKMMNTEKWEGTDPRR